MEHRGLLFIPDISGFTRFVSSMEIEHSRMVIQELLEVLIGANRIDLEVSEIEGDAILFYRFGQAPSLKEIYDQVERMFCDFHRRLQAYEVRRYCYCPACCAAAGLTIKIITHYGEFTTYTVGAFKKLIGRDVIVAHQLMKNDIHQHEYWLATPSIPGMEKPPGGLTSWMEWQTGAKKMESGEVPYHYTQLGRLKENLTPESMPHPDLPASDRILTLTREYPADIITVFHATGDFRYRHRWQEGVRSVEELHHYLPRVGMQCRCVTDDGETIIRSSGYSFSPERIEFTETDDRHGFSTHYILEKLKNQGTRLTIELYRKGGLLTRLLPWSTQKSLDARMTKSMRNLDALVKEIRVPK